VSFSECRHHRSLAALKEASQSCHFTLLWLLLSKENFGEEKLTELILQFVTLVRQHHYSVGTVKRNRKGALYINEMQGFPQILYSFIYSME
jgi:hypothetical protein